MKQVQHQDYAMGLLYDYHVIWTLEIVKDTHGYVMPAITGAICPHPRAWHCSMFFYF